MTSCWEFPVLLSLAAVCVAFHSKADELPTKWCPSPTNLSYEWLDDFTLNLSWKEPRGLPNGDKIEFLIVGPGPLSDKAKITDKNYTDSLLTEEHPGHWMYRIWTVSSLCNRSTECTPATKTIAPRKPKAALVKDFKCLILSSKKFNCSWIPANLSESLTFSYRPCGRYERGLKTCKAPYHSGERSGCYLSNDTTEDICVLMETDAGMSTFKAKLELPPPKVSIEEVGDRLSLRWAPPVFGKSACWTYEICFTECDKPTKCPHTQDSHFSTPYNKSCLYEFKIRVMAMEVCQNISSGFTERVSYGANKPPDGTLTVVAIVIPVILSICVILSCYCFRRYKLIFCPVLPDPSAIFKDLMMNGNKDREITPGNLYMPVPEPVEPCKITLAETSVQPQNS